MITLNLTTPLTPLEDARMLTATMHTQRLYPPVETDYEDDTPEILIEDNTNRRPLTERGTDRRARRAARGRRNQIAARDHLRTHGGAA